MNVGRINILVTRSVLILMARMSASAATDSPWAKTSEHVSVSVVNSQIVVHSVWFWHHVSDWSTGHQSSKQETLTLCWFVVGPASQTLGQQQTNTW